MIIPLSQAAPPSSLPARQKLVALVIALAILVVILDLVRRRKLREEYAVLWLVTGVLLLVIALNYSLLLWLTHLVGAVMPVSTLLFLGLIFLILVSLQFSVRLSTTTRRLKDLNQKLALLEEEVRNHLKEGHETETSSRADKDGKEAEGGS